MRDCFSSQPPDLMARLSGTTSSLAWGEKCNVNHEATTKVLYCPFFLLWLHNKTCNSHNTDQEVLVSPHLWIKTTYERTVPCANRLRPRSSRAGCENWVHFSRVWITILWVEYFMGVNISHHYFFSSLHFFNTMHLRLEQSWLMLWNQRPSRCQRLYKTKQNSVRWEEVHKKLCNLGSGHG